MRDYTLRTDQSSGVAISHLTFGKQHPIFGNPVQSRAMSAIFSILMDAQGKTEVTAVQDGGLMYIDTYEGDDTINVKATGKQPVIDAGTGDDVINVVHRYEDVDQPAGVYRYGIRGGAGNDTINVHSDRYVDSVYGGDGDDTMTVKGRRYVSSVYGGAGDDHIAAHARRSVGSIDAGSGNDRIEIESGRRAAYINAGDGDDTIEITAAQISMVSGGSGNDRIALDNRGYEAAQVTMSPGHDTIETNGALHLTRPFIRSHAPFHGGEPTIVREKHAIEISFAGTDDRITVQLKGSIALDDTVIVETRDDGSIYIGPDQHLREAS